MNRIKALFIVSHDDDTWFAGWNHGKKSDPLWAQDIHLARVYTNQNEADTDYEALRVLGYDVEVQ